MQVGTQPGGHCNMPR